MDKSYKNLIAHIKCPDADCGTWEIQSLMDHSLQVALLAGEFASVFGGSSSSAEINRRCGLALGLLHDAGKADEAFQRYIMGKSGYKPELSSSPRHPHAADGALLACKCYGNVGALLAPCIFGHHGGLPNLDEMGIALKEMYESRDVCIADDSFKALLPADLRGIAKCVEPGDLQLWVRMMFSALVDADRLDTEKFMSPRLSQARGNGRSMRDLLPWLERYLDTLHRSAAASELNKVREEVQYRCREAASLPQGFYSLTVPTGGGKTLASLLWAMTHAVRHGLDRIIIAIPYTSIIVQTAAILRGIFGDENVLEHHSSVHWDDADDDCDETKRWRMAAENWDAPIIVTTNVQLFESLFSNRPGRCRKLHRIARSVIILDEAQMLPLDFMQPIVDVLKSLQRSFSVSVMLTTASQPAIAGVKSHAPSTPGAVLDGIGTVHEVMPDPEGLSLSLRRAEIKMMDGLCSYNDIAGMMCKSDRALCIVNTRKSAKVTFEALPDKNGAFHLSRMMCPAHISKRIGEIREALRHDAGHVRVVSTQLIEAGVDIDFPEVFREKAGLDSIVQAAGRCNREGRLPSGTTWVFETPESRVMGVIGYGINTLMRLDKDSDWLSPSVINDYFTKLYSSYGCFDKMNIGKMLSIAGKSFTPRYKDAAECFKLIDDTTVSVVVNYEDSMELIESLKSDGPSPALLRRLNNYGVGIPQNIFKALRDEALAEQVVDGVWVVPDRAQYDEQLGLLTDNHWLDEIAII